jgi:hypothetical protein
MLKSYETRKWVVRLTQGSKLNYFDIYNIFLNGKEWHKIFLGNSWTSLLENTRDSKEGWMSHIFHKSKLDNIIVWQQMSLKK